MSVGTSGGSVGISLRPARRLMPTLPRNTAIFVALALDLIGEVPTAWHPVVWYGKLISQMERHGPQSKRAQLAYGGAMILLAAPVAILPAILVQRFGQQIQRVFAARGQPRRSIAAATLIEGAALTPFFALRMLVESGHTVRMALVREDLPAARQALGSLVSRDRANLSAPLIAAAAVESLAENLSDSVVAPLLYYTLFGLPGATFYRLVNTFDSMIGYHGHYEYLGKAAARLDDALNLVPARLTALLITLLAPYYGGNRHRAWHMWRRDARTTASPNAGHPMAAAAGAFGVQLEKVGHYTLGDATRPVTAATVRQAEQMVWQVGSAAIFLLTGVATWRRRQARDGG